MSNLRVLFIGPFPPPLGGAIVESLTLCTYLEERDDLSVIKVRTNGSVMLRCKSLVKLLWTIPRVDTVFVYGSRRGISRFSVFIVPLSRLFAKRCVIKITGGNFWEYFQSSNKFWKAILKKTLLKSDLLLLETKYLVSRFEGEANNIRWLPMLRKFDDSHKVPKAKIDTITDGESHEDLRVAYFGHVRVEKGILDLVEASKKLTNVHIDVFGEFIGLDIAVFDNANLNYKGTVQPNSVFTTMLQYDVLVLPTFYSGEGYPGVIIEAKKAGLAVVSTQWRSIPEIVNNNIDGILFEPKNVGALVRAFEQLRDDRALLKKLQEQSLASFAEYDLNRWGTVLIEYLKNK